MLAQACRAIGRPRHRTRICTGATFPDHAGDVGNLPQPSSADWSVLAWQSFVAANWPVAPGARGFPTRARRSAPWTLWMPVPVVWMTSKGIKDVFLRKGRRRMPTGSRKSGSSVSGRAGYDQATSYVLGMSSKTTEAFTAINLAPFPGSQQLIGPLVDQARNYLRFDVRMSQSEFAYFLFFNITMPPRRRPRSPTRRRSSFPRSADRSPTCPICRPLPSMARSSTRPPGGRSILRSISSRAIPRRRPSSSQPDGTCIGPQLMGLTGLHILRLTPSTPRPGTGRPSSRSTI